MKRAVVFAAALCAIAAEEHREAGRVEDYDCKHRECVLLRDGASQPIQQLLPVREGDIVEIREGQAAVVLWLAGKEVVVCGDPRKPPQNTAHCDAGPKFTVPRATLSVARTPDAIAAFFRSFGSWLSRLQEEPERVVSGDVPRPGESIDIPLLPEAPGVALIAEGRRTFVLPWRGCRPALVGLYRGNHAAGDDDPVMTLSGQSGAQVRLPDVSLYEGEYHVVMSCEADKNVSARRDVTVLKTADLPLVPDFSRVALPPGLLAVARAGWLAANNGSQWRLEAYLQIDGVPDRYGSARVLREALARGSAPPGAK